jgi:Mn2+/Fe2+ NRAMP family transporter
MHLPGAQPKPARGFEDLEPASLPPFPGLWAAVGPGLVWLALAQGSGELIFWPYLVAKYGLAFVILLVPAHLMQIPVNTAIGRYTILTGEPIFRGFLRLHRTFAIVLWLWMFVLFLWIGGWASAGGTALAELFQWPATWPAGRRSLFWGYVLMAVFFAALVLGRQVYRLIERFMTVVAVVTLLGLFWACSNPVVLRAAPAFFRALLVPGPWPAGQPSWDDWSAREWSFLLTAICFAGLGGFWTLFYSYWIREKGWGMARSMGHITSPLTGSAQAIRLEGFRCRDMPEDHRRYRGWMRALLVDNRIGVLGNLLTTLLMCLLSWAILHPQGKAPDRWTIAVAQADFFGSYWAPARMLFLFVAAFFLVDAWLAGVDAVSRVHAHMVCELSPTARVKGVRFWYYAFVVLMAVASGVTMPLGDPATILVASGVVNLAGITVYSVALYILTARKLRGVMPDWALPRWWESAGLWVSILVYGALGIVYFLQVAWPLVSS